MTSEPMTADEARKVLEAEQQARLEDCRHRLDALLQTYKVQLSTQIAITPDGRIVANVVLVNAA